MKRLMARLIRVGLLCAAALLGLFGLLGLAGARINITPSIAPGLYWISSQPLTRGVYVQLCPPQSHIFALARTRGVLTAGACPGDVGFLMKRIQAIGKDRVRWSNSGVTVNGQLLPGSAIAPHDHPNTYAWPRYHRSELTLQSDEVLVMGDNDVRSFDSRYFGPLQQRQIRSVLVPVMTWSGMPVFTEVNPPPHFKESHDEE